MLLLFKLIGCLPEIQGYYLLDISQHQQSSYILFIYSVCNKKTSPKWTLNSYYLGSALIWDI